MWLLFVAASAFTILRSDRTVRCRMTHAKERIMGIFRNRGSDNSSSNNSSTDNSSNNAGESNAQYLLRIAREGNNGKGIADAVANASTGGDGAQTGGRREGDNSRSMRRNDSNRTRGRRV
jgi:hypothetical protein